MQQTSENAWLLHSRKYTDTRILVDLLCEHHGLISGVYRVPSKVQPPQMFRVLNIYWKGKHELKNIITIEADYSSRTSNVDDSAILQLDIKLQGQALYCGFYLNELLVRLMARDDPHSSIFIAYSQALRELNEANSLEPALRKFEFHLLDELGYGLDFSIDTHGQAIEDSIAVAYKFELEEGFVKVAEDVEACDASKLAGCSRKDIFSGTVLAGLASKNYSDLQVRRAAKFLSRQCIDRLLGGRALKSRELFRSE